MNGVLLYDMFYLSKTFLLIENKVADLHCRSDEYLRDELILEVQETETNRNPK